MCLMITKILINLEFFDDAIFMTNQATRRRVAFESKRSIYFQQSHMPISTLHHRNSQKRCYDDNLVYFIVTKTFQNFPYFKEPIFCELLIEELKLCKEVKRFKLYGFCVVYDHLNLIIHPGSEFNISKIMFSIKKQFSHNVNRVIGYNELSHNEGEQTFVRLRYGTVNDEKKLIDNHNKIVNRFHNQFTQKYGQNQAQFPKFKWQKSYYDHIIRNTKDFEYHYNYAVYNFQKHNLPKDWKYTSLNYNELVDKIDL